MDFQKIRKLQETINKNKQKLIKETDYKKREILKLRIGIDQYRMKLERLRK